MALDLLTDPDRFFRRRADGSNRFIVVLVVAVAGLALSADGAVVVLFGPEVPNSGEIILDGSVAGFIAALVAVVILWVGLALVLHLLSMLFDGEGLFRKTLGLTGWAFAPSIISGLLSAAAAYYALRTMAISRDVASLGMVLSAIQNNVVYQAVDFGSLLLIGLWQTVILVFALKHARGLTRREAALTVAIPVVLLFAWGIAPLLGVST
jgi:hypothetical protein